LSLGNFATRSVPGCDRGAVTAKLIADAASDHADFRAGIGCDRANSQVRCQESLAFALPENEVVFDASGPIRGETVLKADTDYSAPTGAICLPEADSGCRIEDVEALIHDGSTALHIK